MSKLQSCKKCGNVYTDAQYSSCVCPDCKSRYDKTYDLIRDYIMRHPNCTMMELATHFRISIKDIRIYIEDERLSIRQA